MQKSDANPSVPKSVLIPMGPFVAPAGTSTKSSSLLAVTISAGLPLKVTDAIPENPKRFRPWTSTRCPTGPSTGLTSKTSGTVTLVSAVAIIEA